MKKFYVYALYRKYKHKPFYIGKGCGDRVHKHFLEKNVANGASPKDQIIREEFSVGRSVRWVILQGNLTDAQALRLEREWIAYYGRIDDGTGCLCNRTSGGEGLAGFIHTDESREKRSEAAKRRWGDTEQRALQSVRAKEQWNNPEFREKELKRRRSPKQRRVRSEANARSYAADPDRARRHSETLKIVMSTPEYKKRRSEIAKALWSDPAFRNRMLKARKHRPGPTT